MQLRKGWKVAGGVAAAMTFVMVGAVSGVWASHSFTDVPNDHPFHDEIAAVSDACIGAGFPDGTYRPGEPVTRQAMAAFLQRAGSKSSMAMQTAAVTFGVDNGTPPSVPIAEVTMKVPDLPGCQQFVTLHGNANLYHNNTAALACDLEITGVCNGVLQVMEDGTQLGSSLVRLNADRTGGSVSVDVVVAASPGVHTYTLAATSFAVRADQGFVSGGRIVATRTPFGSVPAPSAPLATDDAMTAAERGEAP